MEGWQFREVRFLNEVKLFSVMYSEEEFVNQIRSYYASKGPFPSRLANGILQYNYNAAKFQNLYKDDRDEIVSIATLKVMKSLMAQKYRFEGSFRGLMFRNFSFTLKDYFTRSTYRVFREPYDENKHGRVPSFERDQDIQEIGEIAQKFIGSLPENQHQHFTMICLQNFAHRSVLESLGISYGNSRTKILRIKNHLQDEIRDYSGLDRFDILGK